MLKKLELEEHADARYLEVGAVDLDDRCVPYIGRETFSSRVDLGPGGDGG